jgi:hypothetical protein
MTRACRIATGPCRVPKQMERTGRHVHSLGDDGPQAPRPPSPEFSFGTTGPAAPVRSFEERGPTAPHGTTGPATEAQSLDRLKTPLPAGGGDPEAADIGPFAEPGPPGTPGWCCPGSSPECSSGAGPPTWYIGSSGRGRALIPPDGDKSALPSQRPPEQVDK